MLVVWVLGAAALPSAHGWVVSLVRARSVCGTPEVPYSLWLRNVLAPHLLLLLVGEDLRVLPSLNGGGGRTREGGGEIGLWCWWCRKTHGGSASAKPSLPLLCCLLDLGFLAASPGNGWSCDTLVSAG